MIQGKAVFLKYLIAGTQDTFSLAGTGIISASFFHLTA
jgi:hypothetical protein